MKKLLSAVILHALLLPIANAQNRLFNQDLQLKTCNITVEANQFIATTFVELEFYNPKDQEVEGLQSFRLNKGQVITAFQLDLNGKYRDGSIEEKGKAVRAYSAIVGKRIDPAILQMTYDNNYSLNIYPVPAHGSRKVTFTIDQLMVEEKDKLTYNMPLRFLTRQYGVMTIADSFNLRINVSNSETMPQCNDGVLKGWSFEKINDRSKLSIVSKVMKMDSNISFSIPAREAGSQLCISKQDGISKFLLRLSSVIPEYYTVKPTSIAVFWDVSASGKYRDIRRELDFLEHYIHVNKITTINITLFNHQVVKTMTVDTREDNLYTLRTWLRDYHYSGATTFGNLDLAGVKADAILLFSDGYNSYGKNLPPPATVQVNCIVSNFEHDKQQLQNIVGTSGGSVINLYTTSATEAVKKIEQARNFLFRYNSSRNTVKINESFPITIDSKTILSGTFEGTDNLQLLYGNSASINKSMTISLSPVDSCGQAAYKKVQMLKSYDSLISKGRWYDMIIFGLTEKVITPQTSYLVLERIEDYIKYNIAPPKELEEACAERNYVYKSEFRIKALKNSSEQDALKDFVEKYNEYVKWWNPKEELINLDKAVVEQTIATTTTTGTEQTQSSKISSASSTVMNPGTSELSEVIVSGAYGIKRTARSTASNVQYVNSDQLNTIRQVNINDALAGKVAGLQIRSQSWAKLGAENIIRLRGENGIGIGKGPLYVLDGTIMPNAMDINPDDVEDVTVLQGPSAAALFGPDGANGAIVINSKRARKSYSYHWSEYKIQDVEDMDYIQEIKGSDDKQLFEMYEQLESLHKGEAAFYFDMADYFLERKFNDKAIEILLNGIEACDDNKQGLKNAAYILEGRKLFREAIKIYRNLVQLSVSDLSAQRDLALAYFQNGEYQNALNTYYQILKENNEAYSYYYNNGIREMAMNEMNAIISIHKNELDLGKINANLVKYLPVDLKISVENSYGNIYNVRLVDPANNIRPGTGPKNEVHMNTTYWYYHNNTCDYSVRKAVKGSYKVKVDSYNYYSSHSRQTPVYIRVVVFKNFQKANQSMEIKYIPMDNQYGSVEIAEIKW